MTRQEAWKAIQRHEFDFEIEDACFGDGSQTLNYKYVLDSKNRATKLKNAIECILNDVKNNPDYPKDSTIDIVVPEIKVISDHRKDAFEANLQMYLQDGFIILSTSCGFLNSESYGFAEAYQAILMKGGSDA